uniref:Protein NYNRIN-like n=1 Tax=Nicotiana tabacum TaxID=4097 RepID=A0A1S4A4C4_TOBAC|nr:PREDICTED: uncharacterized protein LOC107793644 [Nicotiana tabacum]
MTLITILEIDIFDVRGINFMGLFVSACGNIYILVAVDYVSKWVEAVALSNNEERSVVTFLKKNVFTRFGTPRAIISDGGTIPGKIWPSVEIMRTAQKYCKRREGSATAQFFVRTHNYRSKITNSLKLEFAGKWPKCGHTQKYAAALIFVWTAELNSCTGKECRPHSKLCRHAQIPTFGEALADITLGAVPLDLAGSDRPEISGSQIALRSVLLRRNQSPRFYRVQIVYTFLRGK